MNQPLYSTDTVIEAHIAALDAAESPRDCLARVTRQSIAAAADSCGNHPEIIESHRQTLQTAQAEAISDGRYEFAYRALDRFNQGVRDALVYERGEFGRLHARMPSDEVKGNLTALACNQWAAGELMLLSERALKGGERITNVTVDAIFLDSGRTITRENLRDLAWPGVTLLTDAQIGKRTAQAEAAAESAEKRARTSSTGLVGRDGRFRPFHE